MTATITKGASDQKTHLLDLLERSAEKPALENGGRTKRRTPEFGFHIQSPVCGLLQATKALWLRKDSVFGKMLINTSRLKLQVTAVSVCVKPRLRSFLNLNQVL